MTVKNGILLTCKTFMYAYEISACGIGEKSVCLQNSAIVGDTKPTEILADAYTLRLFFMGMSRKKDAFFNC